MQANILRKDLHKTLVSILDDAVVVSRNVNVDVGFLCRAPTIKSGQENRGQSILSGPAQGAHDIFRVARCTNRDQDIPIIAKPRQLVDEHVRIVEAVGDRRQQRQVGRQRKDTGPKSGVSNRLVPRP